MKTSAEGRAGLLAAVLAAVLAAAAPQAVAAAPAPPVAPTPCGAGLAGAQRLDGVRYQLAYVPQPATLAVGRDFALDFQVCAKDGAVPLPDQIRVDARMPDHGHGMSYRTSVKAQGPGRWRAEGLLLHMAGRWELSFELGSGPQAERLVRELQLK